MAATLKIPTTFTAQDKFSKVIRNMIRNVKTFRKSGIHHIKAFDRQITKTFKKMSGLARFGVGLGAGFIARDAIKGLMDFEQALADLRAAVVGSEKDYKLLAIDAERLGAITTKSAVAVVGLQEAFGRLGFKRKPIIDMTESVIQGSIAMNGELVNTAKLVGGIINAFDKFKSTDVTEVIDKMTLATTSTALEFEHLETGLPIVAGAANAAGVSFSRLLALMGSLANANIDVSSSSTALRNIFITAEAKGQSYTEILEAISKSTKKLTVANDVFGKRGAVPSVVLSQGLEKLNELTKKLTENFKNSAKRAADIRADTLGGDIEFLNSKYRGLLIATDDSTGALHAFRGIIQFVTEHMGGLILTFVTILGLYGLMKTAIMLHTFWTFAMGVAMGVAAFSNGVLTKSVAGSTGGMIAYTVLTWLATAATTAWGIAIELGLWPLTLIMLAIVGIIALFMNWRSVFDWFGKQWVIFTKLISFAWDSVVSFFEEFSFRDFFLEIGKSIITFMLWPLKQVLKLINLIPGIDFAQSGLNFIDKLEADVNALEFKKEPLTSPETKATEKNTEERQKGVIELKISDEGGNIESATSDGNIHIPIFLTNTMGQN